MAQRASILPGASFSVPVAPTKNIRTGYLFIAGALVLAAITGLILVNVGMSFVKNMAKPALTQSIVVAASSIPAGQIIALQDLKVVKWPSDYAPEGDVFESPASLVGRIAKTEVLAGEPLYRAKLAGEYSTGGLKLLLPKGLRGMTVAVSEVSGVGGFVKPGDRVDIVAIFSDLGDGSRRLQKSQMILQDVMVMAAAQQMTEKNSLRKQNADPTVKTADANQSNTNPNDKNTPPAPPEGSAVKEQEAHVVTSVTLALSPEQIEKLALADETAKIRLVLRSEDDHILNHSSGVTNTQLTGISPTQPSAPARVSVNVSTPTYYATPVSHGIEFIENGEKSQWSY